MSGGSFEKQLSSAMKEDETFHSIHDESLLEENESIFKTDANIETTKQTNEIKEVQNKTEKLYYDELLDRIQNKKYDRSIFVRWKKKQSESMREVTESTKALSKLLLSSVGEVDFETVKEAYRILQKKCLDYLTSHHPKTSEGIARKDLVKKMFDRVSEEMRYLNNNADAVTEEDVTKGKKWSEVLAGAHVIVMGDGTFEIPEEAAYAGTSVITKLKGKKEGENYFFKNREVLVSHFTAAGIVADITGSYVNELIRLKDENDPVYKNIPADQKEERKALLEKLIDVSIKTKDFTDNIEDITIFSASGKWGFVKDKFKEEDKPYVEMFFKEIERKKDACDVSTKFAKIDLGSELDIRNVATTVLADYLGLDDMIAASSEAVVQMQGKQQKGIRMEQAKGENSKIACSKVEYENMGRYRMSTNALDQLMKLQVFDLLCGQVDRNMNNFLVQLKTEGNDVLVDKITGIDNDLSFGLLSYTDTTKGKIDYLKPIQIGKEITLPGLDAKFADKLLAVNPEAIEYLLSPFLTKKEIKACQDRLKGIQMAIREMKKRDKDRKKGERPLLITDDKDWLSIRSYIESNPEPVWKDNMSEKEKDEYKKLVDKHNAHKISIMNTSLIDEIFMGKPVKDVLDKEALEKDRKRKAAQKK